MANYNENQDYFDLTPTEEPFYEDLNKEDEMTNPEDADMDDEEDDEEEFFDPSEWCCWGGDVELRWSDVEEIFEDITESGNLISKLIVSTDGDFYLAFPGLTCFIDEWEAKEWMEQHESVENYARIFGMPEE